MIQSVRRRYGTAGIVVASVAVGVLLTGGGIATAAQITNVFVTNDVAHPVQITGPVRLAGPAQTLPAKADRIQLNLGLADGTLDDQTSYTVPAGKDLIINAINGGLARPQAEGGALNPRFVLISTDGNDAMLPGITMTSSSFGTFSEHAPMFAANSVTLRFARETSSGTAAATVFIYGYLVNEGTAPSTAQVGPAQQAVTRR